MPASMTTDVQLPDSRAISGADKSETAKASSANARLNIAINVERWKTLAPEHQELLTWFHQFALDRRMSIPEMGEALNYDGSTIHRVLYGTYEGSWHNVCNAIKSYKRIQADRGDIQRQEFVENSITRKIGEALTYTLANNSITTILGESQMGKSAGGEHWRDQNNHGRSVFTRVPAYGGTKAFLRRIALNVGVNKNLNTMQMFEACIRAFNKNRILIVDEGHRMLPVDPRSPPVMLEMLRDFHDESQCAVAVIATFRFDDILKNDYMFEQFLGRIGLAVRLSKKIKPADYDGIVRQYVRSPGAKLMAACDQIANQPGRLGNLVKTLRLASRIASKDQKTDKPRINDDYFFKALKLRQQMQTHETEEKPN